MSARVIVGLVDYQAGNLHSIGNAFDILGSRVRAVKTSSEFDSCTHLVLPGVGAFGFCAERLCASGMVDALRHWVFDEGRPLLGICVGMQLLADGSDESVGKRGLGWLGGRVRRLQSAEVGIRVPHVGWNTVRFNADLGEFRAGSAADFYFDHSYACGSPTRGEVMGHCLHGGSFGAVWRLGSILASQFHPEKSQAAGLRFLRGFLYQ